MLVAKLVSSVWSTRKAESMRGLKLMLVELVGGTRAGESMMVVDTIGAGIGDRVIVCTGSAASRMLDDVNVPVDAVVVGIIDEDCDLPVD
ncbi:EutN/CcmL family microcompartment protein [Halodesulfovibrio spirochaetisodalis]|uniref:Ethanolamine utilization protein EutN n=1 Tax=Halodesulfovibrio spirochaetisodalis TaxID=1560234 RepID=A0A1B7XBB1_9BACT|nr:EutN/CcmL family microcompartment protein [Halodesulfovibrio spirochaetisodalis]OBQ46617.1 ethanolamine utilization protein EutN [Halodesulfovibrio spirochaetisodalis]